MFWHAISACVYCMAWIFQSNYLPYAQTKVIATSKMWTHEEMMWHRKLSFHYNHDFTEIWSEKENVKTYNFLISMRLLDKSLQASCRIKTSKKNQRIHYYWKYTGTFSLWWKFLNDRAIHCMNLNDYRMHK